MKRQPQKNAATVYLSKWPKASDTYKTLRGALSRVAQVFGDANEAENFDWGELRYKDTRGVSALLLSDGLKPPTVNKCLSALRGVLETAWRLGQIPDEEYRRIEIKNVPGRTLPAGRHLDNEEVEKIFAALDKETPRNAALIACLVACGIRRVELVRLRREDYDSSAGELTAYGKGNKARAVPVSPRWRQYIERWWVALENDSSLAFAEHGTPKAISRSAVSWAVASFIERVGLKKFTPHDLRRTFITRVTERADPLVAQGLAGHANLNTTAIYDRRGKAAAKKAVEDL